MKCAMEMKIAVEEKLLQEKIKRAIEEQKALEKKIKHYTENVLPKLNALVEKLLLQGNGKATLKLKQRYDEWCWVGEIDDKSYPNNNLPYWELRRSNDFDYDDIFPLDDYKQFLESLCYDVTVKNTSFMGCSASGKSKNLVYYTKMTISIPDNPCQE